MAVDRRALSVVYHDLPISSFAGFDRVWQIENVLAMHDRGYFRDSALLVDAMDRDERIGAVLDTRVAALVASPVEVKPADASARAAKIAQELGGDDDNPGLWSRMFPAPAVRELTRWGVTIGLGVAEILWTLTEKRWTPRLKVWHPQFIYFDWATFRYMVLCVEGVIPLPNTDEQIHSDGKWFVWAPNGYRYGWLRGLVRRLGHKYVMRGWTYRDWARYNERHGMAILGAVVPEGANEKVKGQFLTSLANIGSDAAVALPAGEDGAPGFDLKVIEATARTYQTFQLFKQQLDADISIAVLGWNQAGDPAVGSQARAQVQDQVRIDKRVTDAKIDEAFRDQVLWWDALFNSGDPELAPIPVHQVEPPQDEIDEANALKALGDAAAALDAADPGRVDIPALFDRAGVPQRSDAEIEAERTARAERQAAMAPPPSPDDPTKPPGGKGPGVPPRPGQKPAGLRTSPRPDPNVVDRYEFQGLKVAVENRAGSTRTWTSRNPDGTENMGSTKMLHDYGYLEDHVGADGEEVDVYVGPDPQAPDVHVVHQRKAPDFTAYDEDKLMLGFADGKAAKEAYLAHRSDGDRAFGGMSVVPLDRFKAKLQRRTGTGPIRATVLGPAETQAADALAALFDRARSGVTALRAGRSTAGAARAKRYPDRLEQNAVRIASRAMAADLVAIKADIDAARDFDDLRERILARYRKMKPDALAELVRKVNLLGHLAGRLTAVKQL